MDRTAFKEGEPLADSLSSYIRTIILSEFPKLYDVWKDLWDEEEREKRMEMLENHFTSNLSNIFNETLNKETQVKDEYIERIEQLLDEISKLETALSVKIPYDDVQSLPLHSMALSLNKKIQKYRIVFEERMKLFEDLTKREAGLAAILGAIPVAPDLAATPTEAELEGLSKHVKSLEAEKMERMATYMNKRQRIVELYKKLGTNPSLNFEKNIVADERGLDFEVTNDNMDHLDDLLQRLEKQLLMAEGRREDLVTTLRNLWNYLEEPEEHQNAILLAHPGCTSEDIAALQVELERCKKEKSANIEKFVVRIRETLVKEWNRCMVSQETRDQFRVFRSNYFNEDIYDLHELEVLRWQDFYKTHKVIYDLYEQHTALFEKLLELHGRGKNANRYQNRGGRLLQEEKQRKLVAKDLPRVEEELRTALNKFVEENNEPFTAFGRPLTEVLNENWSAHFDQKTIDKFRNPMECKGRTPLAVKRPAQPSSASAKICRMAPLSAQKMVTRSKHVGNENDPQEPDSTIHIEPSYDDFQKTFKSKLGSSTKLVSRSTEVLTPRKVFRERNGGGLLTAKSTQNLAITPRTVPRINRAIPTKSRTPLPQTRTPVARTRLPLIL